MANKSKSVAILGLGPSLDQYTGLVKRLGSRRKLSDETWTINALGDAFACDLVFHMDDVRIQEIRAAAHPDGNIAPMLEWLKTGTTPVITSRPHPDYPALQAFPLQAVAKSTGYVYFNSTAAYAVAYAIHRGFKTILLFGCDFTYPNAHHAEKGRGCVEFWLGFAAARGVQIKIPRVSSLMDGCVPDAEKLYGYDTLDVTLSKNADGSISVKQKPRKKIATADEIENRYDHSQSPNPIVRGEQENAAKGR